MKIRFRQSKVASTHTLQFTAILITGFLLYEPLGTAIFLLGLGVGLLIYLTVAEPTTGDD